MLKTVFDDFRNEEEFHAWVDTQSKEIRQLAYEKRSCVYKRELEQEIQGFESIKKAWLPISRLRNINKDVNIVISIDKQGYHSMYFIFPISEEQLEAARKHRKEVVDSLNARFGGHDGSLCYSLDESVYDTVKDTVNLLFPFANRPLDDSYKAYQPARQNLLLRKTFVTSIK